jgi:hypothetical protein
LLKRQADTKGVTVSDVVVRFPVRAGVEAQLFGTYLSEFMARLARKAELLVGDDDAPCLMVRSDPMADCELKELIFQQDDDAKAFSSGWARARLRLAAR